MSGFGWESNEEKQSRNHEWYTNHDPAFRPKYKKKKRGFNLLGGLGRITWNDRKSGLF
jgi:hypothetical protein